MKKTVNIIIVLENDWTNKLDTVMRVENIPSDAARISTYNKDNNTTTICFNYIEEREVY